MSSNITKRAADLLDKLASDCEKLRQENNSLKVENERKDKQIKLASYRAEGKIDPVFAEQLSSLPKDELDRVSSVIGLLPERDFGMVEKRAKDNATSDLAESRRRISELLRG